MITKDELLEKSLSEIQDLAIKAGNDFLAKVPESKVSKISQFQLTKTIMRSAYDYLIGKHAFEFLQQRGE